MSWEDTVTQLYGLADGLTGQLEKNKTLSIEDAAKLPEVQALKTQLAGWLKKPGNVDGLLEASERARTEHRKLVMRLRAKKERGESYTAAEMDQLISLWEADTTLSKEALLKASETTEILRFTKEQLMPWLKLAVRLSLIPVKDERIKTAANTILSFQEGGDAEPSVEQLEEAVCQTLAGERPLREIAALYGVPSAQLIRLAVRYSDAGRETLRNVNKSRS
jgi:hypothetical protein